MPRLQTNTLYYGDNLPILRDYIPDESIDLIYLDPPFNSNRSYNVLFRETAGPSPAQTGAFEDTWHWGDATIKAFEEVVTRGPDDTARLLSAMMGALGHSDVMAYLSMMAIRLLELRRVLKPSGSIYLHCDPTAGHYLKVLMDSVFGPKMFRNEIVWQRSGTKSHAFTRFPSSHDVLLAYGASPHVTWSPQYVGHSAEYLASHYASVEPGTGRRYTLGDVRNPNPNRPNLTYEWRGQKGVWRWTRERMERLERCRCRLRSRPSRRRCASANAMANRLHSSFRNREVAHDHRGDPRRDLRGPQGRRPSSTAARS